MNQGSQVGLQEPFLSGEKKENLQNEKLYKNLKQNTSFLTERIIENHQDL